MLSRRSLLRSIFSPPVVFTQVSGPERQQEPLGGALLLETFVPHQFKYSSIS